MNFLEKKFNNEIEQLKSLGSQEGFLHPLSQSQIKQNILRNIENGTVTTFSPKRYKPLQDNLSEKKFMIYKYALVVLLGLGLTSGTVFASENAKPGNLLFPVKKAKENIQLSLAVSAETKTKLQSRFAEKRVEELVQIKSDTKVNVKTQTRAETEVNNAIQTLTEVKTELEAKGNTAAASAINETILRLKTRLENNDKEKTEKQVEEKRSSQNRGDDEDDDGISNQPVAQGGSLIKVEIKGKVVSQNGQLQISASGKTYILENTITGVSLQSFIGQFVELKGMASGSVVTVTKIEAKDSDEKSEAKEEDEGDDEDDDRGQSSGNQATSTPPANTSTNISLSQVLAANSSQKCWTIVGGQVYDLTAWINQHPGGKAAIAGLCGKDGTASFIAQHGSQAKANQVLTGYQIGTLIQ